MKHVFTVALAAAVGLAASGTAHAQSVRAGEVLVSPSWLGDFRVLNPAPPAGPRRGPVPAARRNPKPVHRPRQTYTSISLYERTTSQWLFRRQGCRAGDENRSGVVILDFGKPAYDGHAYGTILFSDRFASDRTITHALLAYAGGYTRCLPRGSQAQISLARGTSNYRPAVPSAFRAGRLWAREVSALARLLAARKLDRHVRVAAADDAEPAWDPTFRRTRDFYRGYRSTGIGRPLFDYGSLDGGIGAIWTARQAFYVAGGMRYARALPEIYSRTMAQQWAELARVALLSFHRPLRFVGVMTQGTWRCRCGLRQLEARRALRSELAARVGRRAPRVPGLGTNILSSYERSR